MNDGRASHGRGASRDSSRSFQQQGGSGRPPVISAGAALYSHAMASVNKSGWGSSGSSPPPSQTSQPSRLPTAAEEKEMLRRYHDATNAVQRHHEANFGPADGVMSTASSSMPHDTSVGSDMDNSYTSAPDELPPPWVPSAEFSPAESLSEKERYRIAYEARERAAGQQQQQQPASPPPSASPPISPPADYFTAMGIRPSTSGSVATDRGQPPPWQPSPPTQPGLPLPPHLRARSPPLPPANPAKPSSQRVMSAAEEKAMLKAKYESEEAKPSTPPKANHSPSSPGRVSALPSTQTRTPPQTPPPLMPRPPASYIQETAEVDARLQDELASTNGHADAHAAIVHRSATVGSRLATTNATTTPMLLSRRISTGSGTISIGEDTHSSLMRSMSSPHAHTMGWDSIAARAGSGANGFAAPASPAGAPPPLPPKVPLEH
jgi:hypothetical protein